jgi:hypothetical protein
MRHSKLHPPKSLRQTHTGGRLRIGDARIAPSDAVSVSPATLIASVA